MYLGMVHKPYLFLQFWDTLEAFMALYYDGAANCASHSMQYCVNGRHVTACQPYGIREEEKTDMVEALKGVE